MLFRAIEDWIQVSWVLQAALVAGILLVVTGFLLRRRLAPFPAAVCHN